MKNIFILLGLFMVSAITFAQTVEVETVEVGNAALERVIIEKVENDGTLTTIPAGYSVFRVFVDLTAGSRVATVLGDGTQAIVIEPTNGEFYNNGSGTNNGHVLNSGFFGFVPDLQWDSYLTMGAAGTGRLGVPYSVNANGYIDGTPVAEGLTISPTFPDIFGTANSSTGIDSNNDLWGTAGTANYESQGITENTVLIGQFTCSADLTFELQIVCGDPSNNEVRSTVSWSSEQIDHIDPVITAYTPATGTALDYGVARTLSATVDADEAQADGLGAITSTVFTVDGTDYTAINAGSGVYTYELTPSSLSDINVTFTVTDASGASDSESATYSVDDPNPTVVSLAALADQISGDDLPITLSATATDNDGIASVEFFLEDGTSIGTGTAAGADTYTFDWNPDFGTYTVYAAATPAAGIIETVVSNTVSTTVFNPSSFYSLGGDVNVPCYADNKFCVPFTRVNTDMANINGFDIIMEFESDKVAPTGVVTVNSDLVDRDVTDYTTRVEGDSIFVSVFLKGNAQIGTFWNGQGEIFCVEFARTGEFAPTDAAVFEVNKIVESYEDSYIEQPAGAESATYSTFVDDIFTANLIFWSDASPIAGPVADGYALTQFGVTGNFVEPNVNGVVEFDFIDGAGVVTSGISIEKDVPNSTVADSMMILINGYDAYLTTKVLTEDASFKPSVFQIMAMDVNLDGRVTAGDISQMNQRAVIIRDEFTQDGGTNLDWIYVNNEALQNYARYRISAAYPLEDPNNADHYWKDNVPSAVGTYFIPGANDDCPNVAGETFQLILLGDVDGSYAKKVVDGSLKSAATTSEIVFDVKNAKVNGEEVSVPVKINASEAIVSASFSVAFENCEFVSLTQHADYISATSNLVEGNKIALVSNTKTIPYESGATIFSLNFKADDVNDIDLDPRTSKVNGDEDKAIATVVGIATDVEENTADAVAAYPVPADDFLTVVSPEDATVELLDINGVIIKAVEVFAGSKYTINVQDLASGLYILKVYNDNFTSVKRVAIK